MPWQDFDTWTATTDDRRVRDTDQHVLWHADRQLSKASWVLRRRPL